MSFLTALITVCAFSLHALFGCCLHHAHGVEAASANDHDSHCSASANHSDRNEAAPPTSNCGESHESPGESDDQGDSPEHECQAYPCEYVASLSTTLAAGDVPTWVAQFDHSAMPLDVGDVRPSWCSAFLEFIAPSSLPLYLAHQTLLI